MLSAAQPTCFLIADISGYTGYLADVELDHAQDILADLIGAVVTALRPNFRLAKLEGDAAFTFATAETIDGSMLLDTIERCYFGFRRRRRDVRQATSCECNACVRIPDLDLKFVVHHGAAIHQKVAGRQELLGSDVIVAHRLLKNEVVEKLGISAYALISQACIDASDLDPAALGMREHTETYDRIGDVPGWVHDLERRWQEEEARARVFVSPEEAILTVSVPTRRAAAGGLGVPHQARAADDVAALGDGGHDQGGHRRTARARLGQPLHARQGRRHRGDPRLAPVRLRHGPDDPRHARRTGEGAPHHRARAGHRRAPRSTSGSARRRPGGRRRSWSRSARPTGQRCSRASPSLVAQLDAALAARDADRGPEPELVRPRPDGAALRASAAGDRRLTGTRAIAASSRRG